jgi:4-carboxymuconolactone decarboxylase
VLPAKFRPSENECAAIRRGPVLASGSNMKLPARADAGLRVQHVHGAIRPVGAGRQPAVEICRMPGLAAPAVKAEATRPGGRHCWHRDETRRARCISTPARPAIHAAHAEGGADGLEIRMSARFPVIPPEAMNEAQRALAAEIARGPRGGVRGPFLALMHHPKLAHRIQALGEHLRFGTGLPQRLVEIVVLVTARRWTCQYEWVAHARIARNEGVPDPVIEAIRLGQTPASMAEEERLVYELAQQAHATGDLPDALFAAAEARFGRAAILDLLALCGYYAMLAMVLNTARPPLPDGVAPPLQPLPDSAA